MALARFLLQDNLGRVWFFEETFLLADTSMEVALRMPFLALNNVDFQFGAKKLIWRSSTIAKVLPITSQVESIDKRKFVKVTLDKNSETFVMHVVTLEATTIHPSWAAQIATL